MAFIETDQVKIFISKDVLKPIYSDTPNLITPVQIVQKRTYLSIKSGYYVANDGGYGIIDGKGEIGSLVVN